MQKRADRYYNNCTQTEPAGEEPVTASTSGIPGGNSASSTTGTQTQGAANGTRDHSTNTIGCPSPALVCQQPHLHPPHHHHAPPHPPSASSSTSSTANSTPNTSRPNSKQSGAQRRSPLVASSGGGGTSKLPISQSESTLSLLSHGPGSSAATKEEAQLLSSVRSMRVDLAIKNKAMQRLTRELDDCKKTIRKLQRDREGSGNSSHTGESL